MMTEEKCIYCGRSDRLCRRAHAIPACMGTFENQPALKNRVCQECDTEIGKCEGQLIKCGIEAILRIKARIKGRSGEDYSSVFARKHYGHGPTRLKMKFPYTGWEVLVEPTKDGENCKPLPQIVMIDSDGNCEQILIKDPMKLTAKELSSRIKKLKRHNWIKAWAVQLDDNAADHIFGLLKELGMYDSEEVVTNIRPMNGTIKLKASGEITYGREYFRAIAKIGFHYFLLHSKLFNGSEQEFEAIRQFIRYGEGDVRKFLAKGSSNLAHDTSGRDRPDFYAHVLRTDISCEQIAVFIQLFIGHDYKPNWHKVILSVKNHPVLLTSEEFGHYYRYLDPQNRVQYDGVIEKISVAQTIKMPKGNR